MAEALYRKYRPQIFEDVVGQEHIERTIKNAIEQDKVSHAYLFTGPRGTGKTTTARLLAKALLCENGPTPEPDGTCSNCEAIAVGSHPDVYELDAASRTGVENVREEIIGRVQFAPTQGRYKVYIIDEVHMLSTAAFNALLKTLEEPPSHVVFILCTTDPQKVPETIHSRCQRFDFRRISIEAIVSRLGAICVAEDVEFEGEALDLIAHRAEGGMRNALTSLEQLVAFGEGKVTMETAERLLGSLDSNDMAEIVTAIGQRNIAQCFTWTAQYIETGFDLAQFTRDLSEHMRNMYILSLSNTDAVLEISEATRRELAKEMQYFGPDRLARMLGVLGDLSAELRTSSNPRLSFEIALTRMVRPDSDLTLEALAERVEALESGYSAVSHVSSAQAVAPVVSSAAQSNIPSVDHAIEGTAHSGQSSNAATTVVPAQQGVSPAAESRSEPVNPVPASVEPVQAHDQAPISNTAPASDMTASAPSATAGEAPASPSCGGEGSLAMLSNPAALQRIWQAALQQIKREKAAYGVLFINTKASFDEQDQMLLIEFLPENAFAYTAVQKPEAMSVVARALEGAVGSPLPFRYTKGGNASAASVPAAAPMSASTPASAPAPTPAQAPMAEQVPAPTPTPAPAPDPTPATTPAPAFVPEPEPVPLSALAPEQAPTSIPEPAPIPAPTPTPAPSQQDEAPAPASVSPNPAASSPQGTTNEEDALKSMISEGFGAGVIFEAVEDEQG